MNLRPQPRRRRSESLIVDLTPLIDVVFLLLIFFMVSTTFRQEEAALQVELPDARTAAGNDEERRLEITVSAQGQVMVGQIPVAAQDRRALLATLASMSTRPTNTPLVIRADQLAPHGVVVQVMDAAAEAGFTRVGIATTPPGN